jgi:predicted TIM-barrel fold metal-dependent hydrolase
VDAIRTGALTKERIMGYIDCDAHVYEPEDAWEYLDPSERHFRPTVVRHSNGLEQWLASGQLITKGDKYHPTDQERCLELYEPGVSSLQNIRARLAHMDRLGVDVQVVFSTFFIRSCIPRPLAEAALARSYNRWMAERCEESGFRIRWALRAPVRMIDRALEEMEFGKEHGATGVHVQGRSANMELDDEYFHPIYAKAEELDLVMTVHVGYDLPGYHLPDSRSGFNIVTEVPLGFYRLAVGDLHNRFPNLRWAWLEAGASWVPFVVHEASRANANFGRTREINPIDMGLVARRNLYVACQIDDDIPYLISYTGEDHMVMGTDFSHIDIGSDINAAELIVARPDVRNEVARKIVDINARRLYGIDPSFTPTGTGALAHQVPTR